MLTPVFLRVAAATAAVVVLAANASSAKAQSPPGAAPAVGTTGVQTTGTLPEQPSAAATPPAAAPSTPPHATSPSAASETKSDDAVANAATPEAPAAPSPAASDAPSQAPAATAAPSAATPAAATPAAPAASTPAPDAAATAAEAPAATAPAPPVVDPVIAAVRTWLGISANTSKAHKEDVAAAAAFYGARNDKPLWVDGAGFTHGAKSAMAEVRKADDWGLTAAAFDLPALTGAPSTEALADAEGKLTLALLKYVRFARGGRVNPASLSRILDVAPPIKAPSTVLAELTAASAPDAYLRDQHPKHPQFQLLHKALLKARGPAEPAVEIDPALKINLPATREMLKVGVEHPNVALLRQRMKVPAEDGVGDTVFDEKLELALKAYQVEKGLKATGELTGATRKALNAEGEVHRAPDRGRGTQMIVLNMERWRWMPESLGRVYVWNNIPEFMTRVIRGDEVLFKERIIVGLPQWATPVFSETMKTIAFNPSWGMPDGIKTRELAPRLRSAGGGFFFFGGGGGGNIIRAYGLDVYRNGRKIDPDSVDWSNADVRNYSFIQPPGGRNPLGQVKFLFPNRHDVYMHDTIERSLFAQPSRALSHGCIRVQDPMRFARVMLAEGNGLDARGVEHAMAAGGEVRLKHPIPVHTTYFTAVADADGRVSTFGDLYGHDGRLEAALTGRPVRFDPGPGAASDELATMDDGSRDARQGKKKKKYKAPDTLADAISGFWMN